MKAEKEFIMLYVAILRMKNIFSIFDNFEGWEILFERFFQDYQSENDFTAIIYKEKLKAEETYKFIDNSF